MTAIVVTRGDVDLKPVAASLPKEWELLVWNNELATALRWSPDGSFAMIPATDLSVYGRYAAIEFASNDLIYVQDDDVIVSEPQAIVDAWVEHQDAAIDAEVLDVEHVVCNMPPEFRPHYPDSALVGFGACFHRDAPGRAFDRYAKAVAEGWCPPHPSMWGKTSLPNPTQDESWLRCCDVVFTTLTPRVLADVPKQNREFAEGPDRMYRQPGHVGERARMLELARMVRDA